MGEQDGTVDKIYLHNTNSKTNHVSSSFNMKYHESHMKQLYADYPDEKETLDKFMSISNTAMLFVKIFIAIRLFPRWIQPYIWKYIVPKSITSVAAQTAEELLPKLTKNKKLISLLSSMWIDTGARPDKASFMMTAAVFRGISIEGGCYPVEGSESMV